MPLTSIIIPTFNRANYLEESLISIFKQDYKDFEIIIVDNNSTDLTTNVVDKYSNDKRLKYYRNESNIGATNNHIKAIKYVSSEYITMFSDDDIMLEGSLRKRLDILESNKNIALIHSSLNTIDSSNQIIQNGHWAEEVYRKNRIATGMMNKKFIQAQLLKEWNFISMPTVITRSSILIDNNLNFNPSLNYLIDWDLWLNISEFGDFYYLNEALINYRRHLKNETIKMTYEIAFLELILIKLSFYNRFRKFKLDEYGINEIVRESSLQINKTFAIKPKEVSFLKKIYEYFLK